MASLLELVWLRPWVACVVVITLLLIAASLLIAESALAIGILVGSAVKVKQRLLDLRFEAGVELARSVVEVDLLACLLLEADSLFVQIHASQEVVWCPPLCILIVVRDSVGGSLVDVEMVFYVVAATSL